MGVIPGTCTEEKPSLEGVILTVNGMLCLVDIDISSKLDSSSLEKSQEQDIWKVMLFVLCLIPHSHQCSHGYHLNHETTCVFLVICDVFQRTSTICFYLCFELDRWFNVNVCLFRER